MALRRINAVENLEQTGTTCTSTKCTWVKDARGNVLMMIRDKRSDIR